MQLQPSLSFRGVRRTESLKADIFERIEKLETYFRPIIGCRVLVEFAEHRHGAGNRYHVRIDLTVPHGELLVSHEASVRGTARALGLTKMARADEPDPGHKYAHVAVHEAFDIARRRLQDYARRQRGAVKTHAALPRPRARRRPRAENAS